MQEITLDIASLDGTVQPQKCKIKRMYNFGSATRDPNAAIAHQDEVAK